MGVEDVRLRAHRDLQWGGVHRRLLPRDTSCAASAIVARPSAVPLVAATVEAGLPAVGKLGCRRKRSRADVVEDQRAPDRHPAHSCGREGRRDDLFGRHRLVGGDDHGGLSSRGRAVRSLMISLPDARTNILARTCRGK